jgi:hypothetical protein
MRTRSALLLLLIILCGSAEVSAQDNLYCVSIFGSLTTSSKLFPHPQDSDELRRGQFLPLDNIFSGGIDIRRSFPEIRIQAGFSIEYLTRSYESSVGTISTRDGYTAIPIELTGYFHIPVGTPTLLFYMGGGIGLYIGSRNYEYAGVSAPTINRTAGAGIHVLSGLEYDFFSRLALRSEVKFRDIQFETTNQFRTDTAFFGNQVLPIDQTPFTSRVHIDGIMLAFGIVFHI